MIDEIKWLYHSHGAPTEGVNIFGIQHNQILNNLFDDVIGFFTPDEIRFYRGTVSPSEKRNLTRDEGAASICLGYHKKAWKLSMKSKKYPYPHMTTKRKVLCWDDTNKNKIKDANDKIVWYKGMYLHSTFRDKYIMNSSWGCQVIPRSFGYNEFIDYMIQSRQKIFSYYLFASSEISFYDKIEVQK